MNIRDVINCLYNDSINSFILFVFYFPVIPFLMLIRIFTFDPRAATAIINERGFFFLPIDKEQTGGLAPANIGVKGLQEMEEGVPG